MIDNLTLLISSGKAYDANQFSQHMMALDNTCVCQMNFCNITDYENYAI